MIAKVGGEQVAASADVVASETPGKSDITHEKEITSTPTFKMIMTGLFACKLWAFIALPDFIVRACVRMLVKLVMAILDFGQDAWVRRVENEGGEGGCGGCGEEDTEEGEEGESGNDADQ